ncbi:hypothetical protein SAMN04487895_104213 [Paenibacillus sophorae]|uniref:Uncharacterized protein n=1 Tax=Paenibacillus sophorae TaxID=1333845 RepID=A0A1H8L7J0_9BACL|nr:hypothetical protein [Paenibacillus sophorae]QWU17401.1 hypothetical protein KP014_09735 [Paenibacillus sophorae]SEO01039.1 hypothetical protein SAMN04487895_104213 [Paenibacillus sophorae]
MTRLVGSAGDGEKIIKAWNNFSFKKDETKSKEDFYFFDVSFKGQTGFLNFYVKDGDVRDVTIDLDFQRPLGSYNDPTLRSVATKIFNSL